CVRDGNVGLDCECLGREAGRWNGVVEKRCAYDGADCGSRRVAVVARRDRAGLGGIVDRLGAEVAGALCHAWDNVVKYKALVVALKNAPPRLYSAEYGLCWIENSWSASMEVWMKVPPWCCSLTSTPSRRNEVALPRIPLITFPFTTSGRMAREFPVGGSSAAP